MTDLEMVRRCALAMNIPLNRVLIDVGQDALALRDADYNPLENSAQAMDLLCWLIRHNDNERMEISNHVVYYQHQDFSYTQLGGFFKPDHLRRALVECVAKKMNEHSRSKTT